MHEIGIFPACVKDASVVGDARGVIRILLESELADTARPGIQQIDLGHRAAAVLAGKRLVGSGGKKDHPAIRQIGSVKPIDVRIACRRYLFQAAAIGICLENRPFALLIHAGKQKSVSMEIKVHVTHDHVGRRLVDGVEFRLAAQSGEDHDGIVPAVAGDGHMAVGVE